MICSLSNNHITDDGNDGYFRTKSLLEKYGIKHFGAGLKQQLKSPLEIKIEEQIFEIYAYSSSDFVVNSKIATENQVGVSEYSSSNLSADISESKQDSFKIVLLHTGREYLNYPAIWERRLSYKLIDLGTDLVVFTHPHVIRGAENYKEKRIYYSLGNCIFPDYFTRRGQKIKWSKSNCYSIGILLKSDRKHTTVQEYGCFYDRKLNKLIPSQHSMNLLVKYSSELCKMSPQHYYNFWELKYATMVIKMFVKRTNPIKYLLFKLFNWIKLDT
jgi:hypothetical protein